MTDGGEGEAAGDVEDAPERLREVSHGQESDPDTEEVGDSVGVLEDSGVTSTESEGGLLTGVVETAGH